MDPLFHKIEEAQVITRTKGVFRQVNVYRRGTDLYAKHGTGYVKLLSMKATSHPDVTYEDIYGFEPIYDRMKKPGWKVK